MRGVSRAAVVAGIVVAGALTLGQARGSGAMTNGLVWGSQKVVQGAQRVVAGMGRVVAGIFHEHPAWGADAPAYAPRHDRDGSAQEVADFVWHGTVEVGQTVQIKGVNGAIIAERASGAEIEVRAEKRGRRSDPGEVRIEILEHEDGVTVCAVYPSSRGRENTCEAGSGGSNSVRNNDVQVTFYCQCSGERRICRSDREWRRRGTRSRFDVGAKSVNGDIEISTVGFAEASTVNGSIDAAMERYDIASGLSFSTVNGSISLDLPDDVDADVDAQWVNGRLESDLPLELIGRVSRHSAKGVLGQGGPELNLRTVNGSIHVF